MTKSWQKWLTLLLRLGFGILLVVASVDKIKHPFEFAEIVENYCIIGGSLSRWIAAWLPYLEAITGALLIIGVWLDASVATNALLMFIFLVLVSQAYARGLDIRCGCYFIEGESTIGLMKILENILLVGFALMLLVLSRKRNKGSS